MNKLRYCCISTLFIYSLVIPIFLQAPLFADIQIENTATATFKDSAGTPLEMTATPAVVTLKCGSLAGTVLAGSTPVAEATIEAIYGDKVKATATTNSNGYYEITNLPATTYDIQVSAAEYIKEVKQEISVVADTETTNVDFIILPQPAFSTGVSMISLPLSFDNPDPQAVTGISKDTLKLARWNPTDVNSGEYQYYGDNPLPFTLGHAYWLKLEDGAPPVTIQQPAILPEQDKPCTISLASGWNMIGNPFISPISWADVKVKLPTQAIEEAVDLQTGLNNGWIQKYAWAYNPDSHEYQLIQANLSGALQELPVWQGCWVKAFVECDLLLGTSTKTKSLTPINSKPSKNDWRMQLVALSGSIKDTYNYIGVASDVKLSLNNCHNILEPPPPAGDSHISLYFPHKDWGKDSGNYSVDIRAPIKTKTIWQFEVETYLKNNEVNIIWPNLTQVPKKYKLTLVDLDTNKTFYMRTSTAYTYNSGPDGGIRHFQLEIDPNPWNRLIISNIIHTPFKANGMTISYCLSHHALVDIQIYSLTGKPVRILAKSQVSKAGINNIHWDGTDKRGIPVPNGPYICQITAITEEGQLAKGVRPILVMK